MKDKIQGRLNNFFNTRAEAYAENEFIDHLFSSREKEAISDDHLDGAHILDLGCGTGRLYSYLCNTLLDTSFSYLGLDPAEEMLAVSSIPEKSRRIGDISALKPEDGFFDRIYLLGVSTYLPDEVLLPVLIQLESQLKTDGKLVVQYTNASSVEVRMRQWLRPALQRFLNGRHVASGSFKIYPRSVAEVLCYPVPLKLEEVVELPASLPFLQHFSPQLAVWISKKISGWAPSLLRMDFLVKYRPDR